MITSFHSRFPLVWVFCLRFSGFDSRQAPKVRTGEQELIEECTKTIKVIK